MATAILLLASTVTGCGGAAEGIRVSSAFTARDAELFDDAADYLEDPAGLAGAWGESWRSDLEARAKGADVIAVVKVTTLVSDVDLQQRKGVRLVPEVSRALKGELPPETDLRVSEGRPGFVSIDNNRAQLMEGSFVLFLKWYTTEDLGIAAHWHIAPASDAVMERVEDVLGLRAKSSSHIVIHKD